MKNLAPIALFVYKRLDTLKKVIETLKANELAKQSDLIIFSDGYKDKNDLENNAKIDKVREFIRNIDGFKSVTIKESEINKGLANSVIQGVTEVINEYGKIIVLEDDLITSPYFLNYMNEALDMYENDDKVASITGYNYPFERKIKEETYFIKGTDCWSWATWKRAWKFFEPDAEKLLNHIIKNDLYIDFDLDFALQSTGMLYAQVNKVANIDSWAIRWSASAYIKDMLCLFPAQTFVNNIGFGKDATHCKNETNEYNSEMKNDYTPLKRIELKENRYAKKLMRNFFNKVLNGNANFKFIRKLKYGKLRILVLFNKFPIIKYCKK